MTPFYLFSTQGNTTLFLEGKTGREALQRAMAIVACEQAALADLAHCSAVMAGGEFCVNACLAFAALLQMHGQAVISMSMAGQTVSLGLSGTAPCWYAEARFPANIHSCSMVGDVPVIRLPGIVHGLVEVGKDEDFPKDPISLAKRMWDDLNLDQEPASGIIWWRNTPSGLEIVPVVQVPAASTINLEGACGSGSLALAVLFPQGEYSVKQPSGQKLVVRKTSDFLSIGGQVHLVARGDLCLP